MLGLGLPGAAGDERRPDRHARDLPQLAEERLDLLAGDPAFHDVQQPVVHVLERHVDVLHDPVAPADRVDHLVGEARRVGVHQPKPADVGQLAVERPQQARQAAGRADVVAVAGGVLSDQVQLDRAVGGQLLGLGQNLPDRLGPHRPADAGDRAEAAPLVAPLGHAEVSPVPRRQAEAGAVVLERTRVGSWEW